MREIVQTLSAEVRRLLSVSRPAERPLYHGQADSRVIERQISQQGAVAGTGSEEDGVEPLLLAVDRDYGAAPGHRRGELDAGVGNELDAVRPAPGDQRIEDVVGIQGRVG